MTRDHDLKSCIRRDSTGARLGVTWSNAIKQVVHMKPEDLHYSEVNGGSGPFRRPNWTPDRGPFNSEGNILIKWKQDRVDSAYQNRERKVYSIKKGEEKVFLQQPGFVEFVSQTNGQLLF